MDFQAWRRQVREYSEITNLGPIARRYFVIGAFDGALTILGIIVGAYAAGVSAVVHGVAPLLAAAPPVVPFLFLGMDEAIFVAIVVTMAILFAMGAYLGNLVRERVVITGLRFVAAGLATSLFLWLLPRAPLSAPP